MPTVTVKVNDAELESWRKMSQDDSKGLSACIRDTMNGRAGLTKEEREEMPAEVKARERIAKTIEAVQGVKSVLCDRCYRLGGAFCVACRTAVERFKSGGDAGSTGGLSVREEGADRAGQVSEAGVGSEVASGALPGRCEGVSGGVDEAGSGVASVANAGSGDGAGAGLAQGEGSGGPGEVNGATGACPF